MKCVLIVLFLSIFSFGVTAGNNFLQQNILLDDSVCSFTLGKEYFKNRGPVNCQTGLLQQTPTNYISTDYIDISNYKFLEFSLPVSKVAGITFYDKGKNVLKGICSTTRWGGFIPMPEGAVYARFSQRTDTNRPYTVTLYKEDFRPKYNKLRIEYRQVFSHEEFGGAAIARIPVHVITNSGVLIVACQAMIPKNDKTDSYVYVARSDDGGNSWSKQQLYNGGNPNLLYDRINNRLYMFNGLFYYISLDEGQSWSNEIPLGIKYPRGWEYCYQSPTTGIQLGNGVLATIYEAFCGLRDHITENSNFVVYSRDYGKTWEITPTTPRNIIANEATIAEFEPNQIMINSRGGTETFWDSPNPGRRVFIPESKSKRKREKWSVDAWNLHESDSKLIEPLCNASFISLKKGNNRIGLFCNPYTKTNPRRNMMLQYSTDYILWHPYGLLTEQDNEVYGYCSLYSNANEISFVYEDIDGGIMFANITNCMNSIVEKIDLVK